MTFTQIARRIIELDAEANRVRDEDRKTWPWDEDGGIRASDIPVGPLFPEEDLLKQFLEQQTVATQYMLAAVMYLGRGDGGGETLLDIYDDISTTFRDPGSAVIKMFGMRVLGKYLEAGLKRASDQGFNIDGFMNVSPAPSS